VSGWQGPLIRRLSLGRRWFGDRNSVWLSSASVDVVSPYHVEALLTYEGR
jgi:hypothetical protein